MSDQFGIQNKYVSYMVEHIGPRMLTLTLVLSVVVVGVGVGIIGLSYFSATGGY